MKIYTGFGDKGNTSLFGGEVVPKSHLRVELYGTIDELNSTVGILRLKTEDAPTRELLKKIQNDLFTLSSEIATPDGEKHRHFDHLIQDTDVRHLEEEIDRIDDTLVPLRHFILPGGTEAAAFGHLCRTVCRRAERIFTTLAMHTDVRPLLGVYLNRLSDLFFVLARYQNKIRKVNDVTWQGITRKDK